MVIENGIYTVYIHHFPNGKMYVGITSQSPDSRWKKGLGYKKQSLIWKAIQKYGWENIEHEIFASNLTQEEACNIEIILIDKLKLMDPKYGYNTYVGGRLGRFINVDVNKIAELWRQEYSVSDISKIIKVSESAVASRLRSIGITKSEFAYRNGIATSRSLKTFYEQHRTYDDKVMELWNQGKYCAEIYRELQLSRNGVTNILRRNGITKEETTNRKYAKIKEHNRTVSSVVQYDNDLNVVNVFNSIAEASRETGISGGHICSCCKGSRKHAGGFRWTYSNENCLIVS